MLETCFPRVCETTARSTADASATRLIRKVHSKVSQLQVSSSPDRCGCFPLLALLLSAPALVILSALVDPLVPFHRPSLPAYTDILRWRFSIDPPPRALGRLSLFSRPSSLLSLRVQICVYSGITFHQRDGFTGDVP